MRASLLMIGLAAGCVEYDITKPADDADPGTPEDTHAPGPFPEDTNEPESDPDDTASPVEDPPPDTDAPPEPDDCPPLDVIDAVDIDASCSSEPVTGPMFVTTEWSKELFDGYPEYSQILSAPVVGQLTDDNGDGFADERDIPDIIATFDDSGTEDSAHGVLRWISGDGSADAQVLSRWEDGEGTQFFPYRYTTPALGDVDGDSIPDIVTLFEKVRGGDPSDEEPSPPEDEDTDHPVGPPPPTPDGDGPPSGDGPPAMACHVGALHVDGTVLWMSTEFVECGGHAPTLADLEGDGTVEIIVGSSIFEGSSGAFRFKGGFGTGGYSAYPEVGRISAVSDLDGDGMQEVLAGNTIYTPEGSERCTRGGEESDGFTAAADFDGDGQGEVVIVGNSTLTIMDIDCFTVNSWTLSGDGNGGPPTVADFDADGTPEIGVATANNYAVYEADGTELWAVPVEDASSHATGSTVFDFEGDGRPEVVYADEMHLYILDGPTGEIRFTDSAHTSRTLHEFPVVVDVDNDGKPEIIVPNGGGHHGIEAKGLYVLGSADDSWLGGRMTWNQHAYNIVNINDDLSVPATPEPNWPFHNNFRSGDLNPVYGTDSPDAIPLADHCTDECDDGHLLVGVRIGNQGTASLRHDLQITLYRPTEPEWTAIEVVDVYPPIAPGTASELIEIRVAREALGPEGLAIIVDDKDGVEVVRECDEHNNAIVLEDAHCE